MTGRRRNKKGRDRQSKVDLSVMSPEERRQYKKKMRRIKEGKMKRRRAIVLWGALLLCLVIFVISQRKKLPSAEEMTSSIKENANGLMSVGGGFFDNDAEYESPSANTAAARVEEAPVDQDYSVYEGKVDLPPMATGTPLDVMHGHSAVDLSQVEEAQRANSAKAAMISNSYFDGTAQRVNSYLQNYGEGKWHALRGVTGDICVFYDGERMVHRTYEGNDGTIESNEPVPFKIVFTVYEDGTFVVTDASEDGKSVDDMETYLKGIVSSGNN